MNREEDQKCGQEVVCSVTVHGVIEHFSLEKVKTFFLILYYFIWWRPVKKIWYKICVDSTQNNPESSHPRTLYSL